MSVNELRLRTTQERLRGDHIDLLGLLQQSTVENAELREELSRLKKLGTVTHVEAEVAVIDTSESDAVIAELRLELNTANTKCKKLDSEKKTYTMKADSKIKLLEGQLQEKSEESSRLSEELIGLKEQLAASAASTFPAKDVARKSTNEELMCKLLQVARSFKELKSSFGDVKLQTGQLSSYCFDKDSIGTTVKHFVESQSCVKCMEYQTKYKEIASENALLQKKAKEVEGKSQEIQKQYEILALELHRLQDVPANTSKHRRGIISNSDSEEEAAAPVAPITLKSTDASQDGSGFCFEEFVRLKKENKELKLELVRSRQMTDRNIPPKPQDNKIGSKMSRQGMLSGSSSANASTSRKAHSRASQ